MKYDKRIERQHKLLNEEFDKQILLSLDKVSNIYFEKYAPIMKQVQEIVDEVYSHTKLTEYEYDKYVYRFVDLGFENKGDNRVDEIKQIFKEVNGDYSDIYVPLITDYIIVPLQRCGINGQRVVKECQRAEFRLVKNIKRYEEMQIEEIDNEFIAIVLYASSSLISYGRQGRVIWNNEEEQVEVEESLDDVCGVVKITELDEMIDFVESYGYVRARQTGSHAIFKDKDGNMTVIPIHSNNKIDKGLAYGIQKQVLKQQGVIR